jgi:hypothetical protein
MKRTRTLDHMLASQFGALHRAALDRQVGAMRAISEAQYAAITALGDSNLRAMQALKEALAVPEAYLHAARRIESALRAAVEQREMVTRDLFAGFRNAFREQSEALRLAALRADTEETDGGKSRELASQLEEVVSAIESAPDDPALLLSIVINVTAPMPSWIREVVLAIVVTVLGGLLVAAILRTYDAQGTVSAEPVAQAEQLLGVSAQTILRDHRIVAGNGVQVRSGPSREYKVIRRVGEGVLVEVLERRNRWSRVIVAGEEAGTGEVDCWIYSRYLKRIGIR